MIKKLFVFGNLLLFLLFVFALVRDLSREWMPYQKEYYQRMGRLAQDPADVKRWKRMPIEIKQIIATDFHRIDRCITCHQGMDPLTTPTLMNDFQDNPHRSHPKNIHEAHPFEKFGCTVCHEGQGLATTFIGAAHTPATPEKKVEWKKKFHWTPASHWEKPMQAPPLLEASCAKCHGNFKSMPETAVLAKGAQLFVENGCIGCHQINGEGGPISTDLAQETADKPLTRIDFTPTGLPKEDWTLLSWIKLHFTKDPALLVPGDPEARYNPEPIAPSGMPNFSEELSEEDAAALTTFVLSLAPAEVDKKYHVPGEPYKPWSLASFPSRRAAGKAVFDKYGCAGCHGRGGKGGRRNFNYTGGFEPALVTTVGTYTPPELRKKIEEGVLAVGKADPRGPTPPLYMPAWKDKIKGEEMEALLDYLFSIAEKQESWSD